VPRPSNHASPPSDFAPLDDVEEVVWQAFAAAALGGLYAARLTVVDVRAMAVQLDLLPDDDSKCTTEDVVAVSAARAADRLLLEWKARL
jgi:hypothetical protein